MANRYPNLTLDQRRVVARHARAFAEATRDVPFPKGLMSAEHLDRVRAMLASSNRRLAEDFISQPLDGFWFPCTPPGESA